MLADKTLLHPKPAVETPYDPTRALAVNDMKHEYSAIEAPKPFHVDQTTDRMARLIPAANFDEYRKEELCIGMAP